MKNLIALVIIAMSFSPAFSQSKDISVPKKFIEKFSIGVGLGYKNPVGHYSIIKSESLLGDLSLLYQLSKNLFSSFNTGIEEDNSESGIPYVTLGAKYSYLNYKETLFPYLELDLGVYFAKSLLAEDDVWLYYSERKSYFGGSLGAGLDLKMSPNVSLDINFKVHSFELEKVNSNFIAVLSGIKIHL